MAATELALEELAPLFMLRFGGLDRAYGRYELKAKSGKQTAGGHKVGGKASTQIGAVTLELWERHLAGIMGLGITPIRDDGLCVFGAIDIDEYDGMDLKKFETDCADKGLPLVVCRTKSGGCHLYLFCKEPLKATLVRAKLTDFAAALGYVGVEIFPKQTELASAQDVGNWINIPYFGGEDTTRYAIKGGSALTPTQFLQYAYDISVDDEELRAVTPKIDDQFQDGPPCLQILSRLGFPEGHRNDSLFSLGVYCKAKFGDEWEQTIDAMNREFMKPPLSSKEVQGLIKGLSRKEGYFYKCKQPPLCSNCNKDLCRQREFGIASANDSPGVMFDNLTKIESPDKDSNDPPIWIVGIEGRRIPCTTRELMDPNIFGLKLMDKLNKCMRSVKLPIWRAIINDLLTRVEIIEAPVDAGPEGRLWQLVEAFCTGRAQARTRDEIALGKPWTEDARTFLRIGDLMKYLEQQRFKEFKERDIFEIFRRRGGKHKQFNIKGKCVQCWSLPAFAQQTEDYDVPTMPEEVF